MKIATWQRNMWCPLILLAALQIKNGVTFECGVVDGNIGPHLTTSRVVGGTESAEGAWPWMVALASPVVNPMTKKTEPDFRCGGALISHLHVLSAAHCSAENLYLARMGSNNLAVESPFDILIERFIVHENFDFGTAYNDLAIALLQSKVKYTDKIHPICLPRDKWFYVTNYNNLVAYVAGWGDIIEGQDTGSTKLQEVQLPIWNLEECKQIYKKYNTNVTDYQLCAGLQEGGKDACQGDSGGPLMLHVGDSFYVIGVVSHGHGCGQKNIPGVFTRINAYIKWIDHVMLKTKIEKITRKPADHRRFFSLNKKFHQEDLQSKHQISDRNHHHHHYPPFYHLPMIFKKYHLFNIYFKKYGHKDLKSQ